LIEKRSDQERDLRRPGAPETVADGGLDLETVAADGAVGYIGTQNEAGGYQGTVEEYVNRYYQITDRPQALEVLLKMEWYGPINGPMFDWWTSPSWKHAWNIISGSGQTGEATNGKNPFTRADLDAAIAAPATTTNWFNSTVEVGWYERGTIAHRPFRQVAHGRPTRRGRCAADHGLWPRSRRGLGRPIPRQQRHALRRRNSMVFAKTGSGCEAGCHMRS
jgi:hypothetical protein